VPAVRAAVPDDLDAVASAAEQLAGRVSRDTQPAGA
jgi:hypothetical protein